MVSISITSFELVGDREGHNLVTELSGTAQVLREEVWDALSPETAQNLHESLSLMQDLFLLITAGVLLNYSLLLISSSQKISWVHWHARSSGTQTESQV